MINHSVLGFDIMPFYVDMQQQIPNMAKISHRVTTKYTVVQVSETAYYHCDGLRVIIRNGRRSY